LWREEPESIPRLGGAVYLSLGGIRRRRRCSSYTLKLGHTCTFDVPNIASCESCPRSPKDPRFASQKLELCQDPRPPKLHLRAARLLYPGCRTSMRTAQWAMILLTATEWPTVSEFSIENGYLQPEQKLIVQAYSVCRLMHEIGDPKVQALVKTDATRRYDPRAIANYWTSVSS